MSSDSPPTPPGVGAMMRLCWQWVREQIFSSLVAAGYDDINPAHIALFRHPTIDGMRPTDLAEQMQVTKQSVNDALGHLEGRGYLVREPDPTDGRARIIRLTAKGRQLETTADGYAKAVQLRIADILGPRRFAQLYSALEDLTDHVARDETVRVRGAR